MLNLPPTLPFNSAAFQEAWADWISFRKEIKKPLTPTAIKMQLKLLASWREIDAIASIEQSVRNGWQGLFEAKASVNSNGNGCHTVDLSKFSVEKPPFPDWRERLTAITRKRYDDWMEWADVPWDERKRLTK